MAQSDDPQRLDVIDVSGPLDNQAVRFITDTIQSVANRGATAVLLQLNSPGVVADREVWSELTDLMADPPIPVIAWIGPAPAVAYGGALQLAASAQVTIAAPGVEVGHAVPTFVAGQPTTNTLPPELTTSTVVVDGPIEGVIDEVAPAIQQLISTLDGEALQLGGQVVFHKPGFWPRFLRLAVTPEAAFMFLVTGLTVAAFEFYAIGPGLAAGVAALSLFLATYGIAALPMRWWALALVILGWWALTDSYQRGSVATLTGLGTLLMLVGGLFLVDGAPQLTMNPFVVTVITALVLLFYSVAMPTVARSRFSTRTIGRDHLIGKRGTALVDFDPDGEIEVDGARWRAAAHREAGIAKGDPVRIAEVDGLVLEVEPVAADR